MTKNKHKNDRATKHTMFEEEFNEEYDLQNENGKNTKPTRSLFNEEFSELSSSPLQDITRTENSPFKRRRKSSPRSQEQEKLTTNSQGAAAEEEERTYGCYERPLAIKEDHSHNSNGSPMKGFIPRATCTETLDQYYQIRSEYDTSRSADLSKAKIIFVGGDHDSLFVPELVKVLTRVGKKVRAVFMEELNANSNIFSQEILDRHFVANPTEIQELDFAHSLQDINKENAIKSLTEAHYKYLENFNEDSVNDKQTLQRKGADLATKLSEFLYHAEENNIKIGPLDHSLYRELPQEGNTQGDYDHNRQAELNNFAANILKEWLVKNPDFQSDDTIAIVSAGRSHLTDGFASMNNIDGSTTSIRSIQNLVKMDQTFATVPITDISVIAKPETYKAHQQMASLGGIQDLSSRKRVIIGENPITTKYCVLAQGVEATAAIAEETAEKIANNTEQSIDL